MRYSLLHFTIAWLLPVICFISCSETDEPVVNERSGQMRLAPSIGELTETVTRVGANSFFDTEDSIRVRIETSNGEDQTFIYVYDNEGIFNGRPAYYFPLDDSYITSLTATWPANAPATGAFEADQREYENFRRADWLVASATTSGIMATDIPVPLFFEHNNCLLEFELVGQNTNGLVISELLIELEVDGEPTACWAYCGSEDGRAAFLLKDSTMLGTQQEGYLIGTIPGSSGDRYTIILPPMELMLEAGKRYLVTLTPRGYDMDMYVLIGTFTTPTGERDTGIAVPFHLPDQGENGDYIIRTPVQLVTASYVIRHYTDDRTPDFRTSTYVLTDDFVMSSEMAAEYIPIPLSLFNGQIVQNGVAIDSLPYGDDQVLELYTND